MSMRPSIAACSMWLLAGCAMTQQVESKECVQRTSDGPWVNVGEAPPDQNTISDAFKRGGESALVKLLGTPHDASSGARIWVFEARRETVHQWCDPPEKVRRFSQSFKIIMVESRLGVPRCEVEVREVVSNALLDVSAALALKSPLGYGPRPCDSEVNP